MLLPMGYEVADHALFEYEYAYFLPWKDAVVGDLEALGARVECLQRRSNPAILASVPSLSRLLVERRIDLVHAHLPVAGIAARLAGRRAGVPVVYTEHNLHERYSPLTRVLNRLTWSGQDAAIAVSADVAESIQRSVGGTVPLHVVLNGVNVRRFAPGIESGEETRRALGIAGGAPVIGTVAVFRTQKRLDHWLEVARWVLDRRLDARFLLVGDGPERERVVRRVHLMGMSASVHWVGLHEDVRPYLAAMDVYLMTSEFEGLPIALLEAMAMGVPPVATMVGGIPEVVRDGISGFVRPFGAIEDLVRAVLLLVGDPERRKQIGAGARETVRSEFSMERMQRHLEAIYWQVVSTSTHSRA